MKNISAVVLAKNEEENIVDCIKSLSWCSEIIVVNDNSSDRTVELAKKNGAIVITHGVNDDFAKQRNKALEKATSEWVLFIDADERVSKELAAEIQERVINTQAQGFFVKRVDFIWSRKLQYGESGKCILLRLGKKKAGKWYGKVHEEWKIPGEKEVLNSELHHYPHKNISSFLMKINFYTTLRAQELYKMKETTSYFFIIAYPLAKFVQNYFFKLGILDGTAGFIHAMMMSFHSFLVRGKLWLLWNKK